MFFMSIFHSLVDDPGNQTGGADCQFSLLPQESVGHAFSTASQALAMPSVYRCQSYPGLLSVAMMNNMTKSSLGTLKSIPDRSQGRNWSRGHRGILCTDHHQLISSSPSYTSTAHLPKDGNTQSGMGLPLTISNQKNVPKGHDHRPIWWKAIPQLISSLPKCVTFASKINHHKYYLYSDFSHMHYLLANLHCNLFW